MQMMSRSMTSVALVALVIGMMTFMQGCKEDKTTSKIINAVPVTPADGASQQQSAQTTPAENLNVSPTAAPGNNETEEPPGTLTADLSQFKSFGGGMEFIVGNKAPASDVMTIINMKSKLAGKGLDTGKTMLSSEISNYKNDNYFVFGSPCDNPVAAELFAKNIQSKGSCQIFEPAEGVIRLIPTSGSNFVMYIGGNSPDTTKKAAKAVEDFDIYRLRGTYVKVTGTIDAIQIEVVR